jgi:two-component system aerobic respiration control sensor histidine kinase ArcB
MISAQAKTAATLLRQSGHTVQVANSGEEAIDTCRRQRPDAVLLDIELPQMSGYDMATSLAPKPARDRFFYRRCAGDPGLR